MTSVAWCCVSFALKPPSTTGLKISTFIVFLLLYHYPLAQSQLGGPMVEDRCAMDGQLPVNPGRNYSDNLSCSARNNGGPLLCFNRSEVCNGVVFCADSAIDEGMGDLQFGYLDCEGTISGRGYPTFICSNQSIVIDVSALCDGHADCTDASDEINDLCESTCLLPYYGGCPHTRVCMNTEHSAVCDHCLPGYVQDITQNCIPLGCDVLQTPENSYLLYSQSSQEDDGVVKATYVCEARYIFNVTEYVYTIERTCQASGVWSGFDPSCIGCGNLNEDDGIAIIIYGLSPQAINATHVCYPGYELSGEKIRTCNLESGIWNGNDTHCELMDCGPLPHPDYGTVQYNLSTFGSDAVYTCNNTFALLGETIRTCQANGIWSGYEPLCEMITVRFESESYTVTEDAGSLLICVGLSINSSFSLPMFRIHLQLYTSEETADENDYGRLNGGDSNSVIVLDDLRRSDCITIFIADDKRYEQDEEFVVYLEVTGVNLDTYEVFTSSNSTITILANDVIFPYGATEHDTSLSDVTIPFRLDDATSPAINLLQPFTFFSDAETILYVNANGLLSFREAHNSVNIQTFESPILPSIPLIAPFWVDINIGAGGAIFYRQTNESTSLQHAIDLISASMVSSELKRDFHPTNVFIATWDRVAGFAVDSNLRNTFQVVLAVDESKSLIFFIYNQLDWIEGAINIGFKNSNGNLSFMLPETTTKEDLQELRLLNNSNVGIPGLYLYQVDESSKLAPVIIDAQTDKPNHLLQYNIGLSNSFCLEDDQEVNFTIHCNPEQNLVPHLVEWTYNQGIVLNLNQQELSNILYYKNDQNSLRFGPVSLSDITTALNVSSDVVILTCQLISDFGQDVASIHISKCAPSACQDGITNDCSQLCSRDSSGDYQCACEEGYELGPDPATCELIDCLPLSPPTNGTVSFTATTITSLAFYSCDQGFRLSGEDTRVCHTNGFWSGSKPTCEDIDECAEDWCGENTTCTNTEGSFECDCLVGFQQIGAVCEDINECESTTHDCSNSAQCVNVPGTYLCTCSSGYQLSNDGISCVVHRAVIAVSVCVAITLLIITAFIIVVICHCKKKHTKARNRELLAPLYDLSNNERRGNSNVYVRGQRMELKQSSLIVQNVDDIVKDIHRDLLIFTVNLKILETIGHGEFGVVYRGHLLKDLGQVVVGVVAIKTLKGFFEKALVDELLKECLKMQQFSHPNVLSLTGVCLDGGPTPFLVMPFMANGSLVSYLRKERLNLVISNDADDEEIKSVALKRLTDMCFQVAKGMEYLASKRFIHRDLAARNCMIDMNFVIKVADFGLSEQLETKDYFRQDKGEAIKLPVKWLAPESLMDYVFSEKSDVWAYGVTCWEIFSGGKVPYVSLKPTELLSKLESGYRMEKPSNAACSDEIYDMVMMQSWKAQPAERPTFSELVNNLSQCLESMAGYLHIGAFDQQQTIESIKFP